MPGEEVSGIEEAETGATKMKISNSKKELARIISENGGWRDGVEWAVQNGDHGRISFSENKPSRHGSKSWMAEGGFQFKIEVCKPISNWHQTILSREEYFHLYPESDADGWIEWKGGECPVGRDVAVDLKWSDGFEPKAAKPRAFRWQHLDSHANIIAYRLHKPEQTGATEKLSDEAVLAAKSALMSDSIEELVRKQTLDQLLQDWRNADDYAKRKQAEADEAAAMRDERWQAVQARAGEMGVTVGVKNP
ncbi:MAG: hypothetical protein ACRDC6_12435 [Shewanella sp.]